MSLLCLIHGAWHTSQCFDRLQPLLPAAGHKVVPVDLPGRGDDKTPLSEITAEHFEGALLKRLDGFPEPAILIAHSMSAFVVDTIARLRPERVKAVVYIAGILLEPNQSMLQALMADPETGPKLSRLGLYVLKNGEAVPAGAGETPHFSVVPPEAGRALLYNECTEGDASSAVENLVAEAFLPMATPVGPEPHSSVPRLYIQCRNDQALSPSLQDKMAREAGCEMVTIDSDHSPFLSS